MNVKESLIAFVTTFAVILVVHAIVTFLYSLIVHGAGTIDWERSFSLAIGLAIALGIARPCELSRGGGITPDVLNAAGQARVDRMAFRLDRHAPRKLARMMSLHKGADQGFRVA